jgi:hypothetical protein
MTHLAPTMAPADARRRHRRFPPTKNNARPARRARVRVALAMGGEAVRLEAMRGQRRHLERASAPRATALDSRLFQREPACLAGSVVPPTRNTSHRRTSAKITGTGRIERAALSAVVSNDMTVMGRRRRQHAQDRPAQGDGRPAKRHARRSSSSASQAARACPTRLGAEANGMGLPVRIHSSTAAARETRGSAPCSGPAWVRRPGTPALGFRRHAEGRLSPSERARHLARDRARPSIPKSSAAGSCTPSRPGWSTWS